MREPALFFPFKDFSAASPGLNLLMKLFVLFWLGFVSSGVVSSKSTISSAVDTQSSNASENRIPSQGKKALLEKFISSGKGETLYCGCSFDDRGVVDASSCSFRSQSQEKFAQVTLAWNFIIPPEPAEPLSARLVELVTEAREKTRADGATLYTVENDALSFKVVQNETLDLLENSTPLNSIPWPPVPLKESNVSAYAVLKGRSLKIDDVYQNPLFEFAGPKKFDKKTGYKTGSMLAVPVRDTKHSIIGVLQLINARKSPDAKTVIPFSNSDLRGVESIAGKISKELTDSVQGKNYRAMKQDLRNQFPVIAELRNDRASRLFGEVDGEKRSYGACDFEIGAGAQEQAKVVEPRKSVRGDIARSVFYLSQKYRIPVPDAYEDRLRVWHFQDPPDSWEMNRNTWIEDLQGDRNPFIDFPERVERVRDF